MPLNFVRFKHARFSARFPDSFRYSRSHYWMVPVEGDPGLWRVGFTKFATRMLGELVDCEWKKKDGEPVSPGDNVGWVEGFKAASDVYCVMDGHFAGGNPALEEDACIIRTDPYEVGWLYSVRGEPEGDSLDVNGYIELLSGTIQKMAETTHAEYQPPAEEEP